MSRVNPIVVEQSPRGKYFLVVPEGVTDGSSTLVDVPNGIYDVTTSVLKFARERVAQKNNAALLENWDATVKKTIDTQPTAIVEPYDRPPELVMATRDDSLETLLIKSEFNLDQIMSTVRRAHEGNELLKEFASVVDNAGIETVPQIDLQERAGHVVATLDDRVHFVTHSVEPLIERLANDATLGQTYPPLFFKTPLERGTYHTDFVHATESSHAFAGYLMADSGLEQRGIDGNGVRYKSRALPNSNRETAKRQLRSLLGSKVDDYVGRNNPSQVVDALVAAGVPFIVAPKQPNAAKSIGAEALHGTEILVPWESSYKEVVVEALRSELDAHNVGSEGKQSFLADEPVPIHGKEYITTAGPVRITQLNVVDWESANARSASLNVGGNAIQFDNPKSAAAFEQTKVPDIQYGNGAGR